MRCPRSRGRAPRSPAGRARLGRRRRDGGRRPPGDHAGQHPLADRVHRVGRDAAGDRGPGLADHRRPVPDPGRRAAGRGWGWSGDVDLVVGGVQAQREALVGGGGGRSRRAWAWRPATSPGRPRRPGPGPSTGAQLVPTRGLVEGLRVVKDAGEVARMERAAAIADAALGVGAPPAGRGRRRRRTDGRPSPAFAAALDHAMRRLRAPRRAPSRPSWPRARTRPSPTPVPARRASPAR